MKQFLIDHPIVSLIAFVVTLLFIEDIFQIVFHVH
jgi:hypothetical protein